MTEPFPVVEWETHTLEALKVALMQRLSRQLLSGLNNITVDHMVDMMVDQIVLKISATVWSDPAKSHTETVTITERNAHPSWKHAKIAELPEGSFRRRFWGNLYEIDPDYKTTTIEHKLTVHVPAVFPENTMQYPEHLGRVSYPISITRLYD